MKPANVLKKALAGSKNISFDDIAGLATAFGFRESRVRGSHHIFTHPQVPELLNLQRVSGKAKPYQVRQLLRLVELHNLTLREGP